MSTAAYDWDPDDPAPSAANSPPLTTSSSNKDDTSLELFLTKSVQAGTQGRSNIGTIYDLDGPGAKPNIANLPDAQSYRGNFREYAQLGNWNRGDPEILAEQPSPDFFWFARDSCDSFNGSTFVFDPSYQGSGDNSVGGAIGPTRTNGANCTPTSVDLSGSCN